MQGFELLPENRGEVLTIKSGGAYIAVSARRLPLGALARF